MTYRPTAEAGAYAHIAEYYEALGDVYLGASATLGYPTAHIADRAFEMALMAGLASWTPYEDALLAAIARPRAET